MARGQLARDFSRPATAGRTRARSADYNQQSVRRRQEPACAIRSHRMGRQRSRQVDPSGGHAAALLERRGVGALPCCLCERWGSSGLFIYALEPGVFLAEPYIQRHRSHRSARERCRLRPGLQYCLRASGEDYAGQVSWVHEKTVGPPLRAKHVHGRIGAICPRQDCFESAR
jgi:hypothetical protein